MKPDKNITEDKMAQSLTWQYVGDFPLNVYAQKTVAVQEQSNQVNPVICFGNGHYTQI